MHICCNIKFLDISFHIEKSSENNNTFSRLKKRVKKRIPRINIIEVMSDEDINKVRKLRAKSRKLPNSDPVLRVRKWLDKKPSPPPIFKIKKIDTEALRRALKRMKGKKVHGIDNIDSYSIKIAVPHMEEALL